MVPMTIRPVAVDVSLSVLALSSRFDGPGARDAGDARSDLSVLALSSRFDGRRVGHEQAAVDATFSTRSVESF